MVLAPELQHEKRLGNVRIECFYLNNLKEVTMEKLTDTLSGIKNIFCRLHNSVEGASGGCVEFTDAARRTAGSRGPWAEGVGQPNTRQSI